jgi:hypothetical protein
VGFVWLDARMAGIRCFFGNYRCRKQMKKFSFPRIIKRKLFTIVFGDAGKRRLIQDYYNKPRPIKARFKMQKIRRAHQGWRNRVHGAITALKIRKVFGRRKPTAQFRR